ncbi:uncharacterized protein LOC106061161 [Biomphalaria glabrata]|uniref:Uncharacterized protein LOC106061161 n=1 Tax=Biomphalaria glabrata TaxID=6526 RepID=A0A9W2YUG9_BIOGL|nr:uncharacterized protein LOC106061161 [Biomphalaria glabrata]XP_055866372.1 uncharacterized protein LOC106061161 [Biomphalaria glabrata]
MFCKRKTQTDRKVSKRLKTEKNCTDLCFPLDTFGINGSEDQTDLADFSSLRDPHHFTSDQSKVQSDEVEGPLIGKHETQESEGGEADLHKHLVGCKKNPGHRQFIPVDTFNLKHLPEGLQDNDLYEYIKVIADLTVRVDVRMSSPDRPKFYSKTTQPYPFSNMSERRNLRTGSGRVWYVNMFQDGVWQDGRIGPTDYTKCWCRKCEGSNSPSNVWWEFDVNTATHVVFDAIEANHTTLRLFYDRHDSQVVSVDKVSVGYVNIDYDWCVLNCVTCDKTLGNKLIEMFKHFENVWEKVWDKYSASSPSHKLTFIVSHPHGCSKQVSVGQWKDRLEVGSRYKFTYTTCTCPGSSGAHVHCLGYRDLWTWSELVHSGSIKPGLNFSGVGYVL